MGQERGGCSFSTKITSVPGLLSSWGMAEKPPLSASYVGLTQPGGTEVSQQSRMGPAPPPPPAALAVPATCSHPFDRALHFRSN